MDPTTLWRTNYYRQSWKRTESTHFNDPLPSPKAYSKMLIFFQVIIINSDMHHVRVPVGLLLNTYTPRIDSFTFTCKNHKQKLLQLRKYIDNYTRHFVPFPISTFALCSVHRTSVIKRPTVDYCVILKNARCTERYICPIVSDCIEQCPANRKHYSLCSKTNETVFYHVCGR